MIVVDAVNVDEVENHDEIVKHGPVYRKELISSQETGGYSVLLVTFMPGARLNFHTHTSEQILYVTEGKGIVATKKSERMVTPGQIIYIAPGEVHWHGATPSTAFAHICIQKPGIALAE